MFSHFNCLWKGLCEALLTAPWKLLSIYDDIDDMWEATLQYCLDQYVPFKKVYSKYSRQPTLWLTPELFTAIHNNQRAKVHAECIRDPSQY